MDKRFKLSVNDLVEKQFHVDFKGYAATEVDEYLDFVIQDYQEYEKMIRELGEHLQEYENQIQNFQNRINELEKQLVIEKKEVENSPSNLDLLKRISNLEQTVFKK